MIYQQPAFVLHSRPYRETSVMLTLLTPQFGKLQATIRGVRGAKRSAQKQAWLQPFQAIQIQWRAQGEQEWIRPQSFEPYGPPIGLVGDANICGLYINELLYRLLPSAEASPDLFLHYQQTLNGLLGTQNRSDQAWWLRQFELSLLQDLGYRLMLTQDASGQPIESGQFYDYQHESGFSLAHNPQFAFRGDCLLRLASLHYDSDCLNDWRRLMRQVLQPYLGHKPLATRALFKTL